MYARDYRRIARDRLSGNWAVSVGTALVAGLLGGSLSGGGYNSATWTIEQASKSGYLPPEVAITLLNTTIAISLWGLLLFIIGGVVRQGYCAFLLKQQDGAHAKFKDLFSQFHRFGDGFVLAFLQSLYTFLWTLLFIIPGIVAVYRYAMAPFILLEHPDMGASEALKASSNMMKGHKWELFCLGFSFIGWGILSALTLGIGSLWLNPYSNAANAAFYREISKQ